jgi:hypothetical protein
MLMLALALSLLLAAESGAAGSMPVPLSAESPPSSELISLSGDYIGTVAITEPVALGTLDLAFNLADNEGVLSGAVIATRTLVFSGTPGLAGQITGSMDGITPTFRLDSELFGGVISGREVWRRFALEGEVHDDGQTLVGLYSEAISGFTPDPLAVEGRFLVVRAQIPAEVEPPPPPPPDEFIYLPLLLRSSP